MEEGSGFGAGARRSHMAACCFNIVFLCRGRARRPPPNAHAEAGSQREGCAAPANVDDRLTPNLNKTRHRRHTRQAYRPVVAAPIGQGWFLRAISHRTGLTYLTGDQFRDYRYRARNACARCSALFWL